MGKGDVLERVDDDSSDEPQDGEDDKDDVTESVHSRVFRQLAALQHQQQHNNMKNV